LTVMDFIVRCCCCCCCCWPFPFLEFHFVSMSQLQWSKENHILLSRTFIQRDECSKWTYYVYD
jgi:hypothetical protein